MKSQRDYFAGDSTDYKVKAVMEKLILPRTVWSHHMYSTELAITTLEFL